MLIQQKTKKQQPCGGERSNAAARTAVCRRGSVTRAPRSRARLIPVTISRDSWRSHVHRTYTAQRVQLFKRQSRNVSLSLGDKKGVFSFAKENTPFDKAAPIHTSILTPCVSMVMMHPAMATPSRMTGTARFKRISSTAAMSAPVHAPVPGSGMATKSSSPHV